MTGDLVAQLKGASFSYYGAPETLHAVDLDVHAGECVVLMGASGSGKPTIVRVLNGLAGGYYRGSVSGDVFLGGLSARDMEAWRRAELVGSVFQDPTAQFFSSQLAGEVDFMILFRRYVLLEDWDKIAVYVRLSRSQMFQRHSAAIKRLDIKSPD